MKDEESFLNLSLVHEFNEFELDQETVQPHILNR